MTGVQTCALPICAVVLDAVVTVLLAYPEIRLVEVQGHTDADGTESDRKSVV